MLLRFLRKLFGVHSPSKMSRDALIQGRKLTYDYYKDEEVVLNE